MRVLHLIPTLGGGGAEKQLSMLAPSMAQQGCETAVAYRSGGTNLEALRSGAAEIFPLPQRGNHHPLQLWDALSLVRKWQPDLVQTWLTQMDIVGGMVARMTGTPHILSERSSAKMYSGGWKDKARIAIGKSAKGIIANSQGGADYWQDQNASGQIIVIPNAIKPLNAVKPDHPWDGKPYFLSAGRLSHEKNAVTAAKAIIAAVEDCPDNYGAIVGDGPDRDFIAELTVKSSASARLRMVGYSSDLEAWLRHATAYISASYVEGQPNVVIEAAQARCPLILSNIKPHHEAVGEGAVYIDADDIAGFAKALAMTATDPSASTMRLDLAFARTGLSALEKITANHLEFYHHVLAQS